MSLGLLTHFSLLQRVLIFLSCAFSLAFVYYFFFLGLSVFLIYLFTARCQVCDCWRIDRLQICRVIQVLDEAALCQTWLGTLTTHSFDAISKNLFDVCNLLFCVVISDTIYFVEQTTIRALSVLVVHLMPKALLTDLLTLLTFNDIKLTLYLQLHAKNSFSVS